MSHRRIVALSAALAFALTGCAKPAAPGVKVRLLATDLGLGMVKLPAIEPGAPPQFPPIDLGPFGKITYPPPKPPVDYCPVAGPLEFPDRVADPFVSTWPKPGAYPWKFDVTVNDARVAQEYTTFPLAGLGVDGRLRTYGVQVVGDPVPDQVDAATGIAGVTRGIFGFNVTSVPPIGPSRSAFMRSDRFRISPDSYLNTEYTNRDDATIPQQARDAAPEDRGIAIQMTGWGEETSDPEKPASWLVVWGPFLDIIHFPIVSGQRIKSVSVGQAVNPAVLAPQAVIADPSLAQPGARITTILQGQVLDRRPIDVCGEVIQAWFVDATMTVQSDGDQVVMDYDYAIATQLGGLVVYQRVAIPGTPQDVATVAPAPAGTSVPVPGSTPVKPAIVVEASLARVEPYQVGG